MTYRSDSSSPFSRILGPLRARQCACHSAQCQRLHQRVTEDLSRRHFLGGMAAMLAPFALPSAAMAAATALADDARPLLLTNLRLFDGSGTAAREGVQVLVRASASPTCCRSPPPWKARACWTARASCCCRG